MKIDSPKSIFNPACAEKISIFSAHAGCALPVASGSLRASSLSAQDFKPTIQAGGLAAYSPLVVPHPSPSLKLVDYAIDLMICSFSTDCPEMSTATIQIRIFTAAISRTGSGDMPALGCRYRYT